jgi:hypothetical protein
MSTPNPVPAPAAPWYTSKVQIAQITALVSAFVAISPKVGNALGLKTAADVQTAVEAIFGAIAVVAPLVGTIFRAKSPLQPLTLTQSAAAAHPATVAAATPAIVPIPPAAPPAPGSSWGK